MKADSPLDYAAFQLSPKRTRCELFASCRGETEKLASGLLKPFITHLRAAEEQASRFSGHLITLQAPDGPNTAPWFTKGTLERFVRFVSTPEVLELVSTVDAEMTQLEAARSFQLDLYSKASSEQGTPYGSGTKLSSGASAKPDQMDAAEASKRELLRAIDARLMTLQQELSTAFARASAAGFATRNMADLLVFAEHFGASRLKDACEKFLTLCQKRQDLCPWRDEAETLSSESDMSIENGTTEESKTTEHGNQTYFSTVNWTVDDKQSSKPPSRAQSSESISSSIGVFNMMQGSAKSKNSFAVVSESHRQDQTETSTTQMGKAGAGISGSSSYANEQSSMVRNSSYASIESDAESNNYEKPDSETCQKVPPTKMLSVQERIHLFESKQKEQRGSSEGIKRHVKIESKRLSCESGNSNAPPEKSVLRRWSGAGDITTDFAYSQQTKNGHDKDIVMPFNRNNSGDCAIASENNMQPSMPERERDQPRLSTSQSDPRLLDNVKAATDDVCDVGLRFADRTFRGQQRVRSASTETETSADPQFIKFTSNAGNERTEAMMQSFSVLQTELQPGSYTSKDRDNISSRVGYQNSDASNPSGLKQPGLPPKGPESVDSTVDVDGSLLNGTRTTTGRQSMDGKIRTAEEGAGASVKQSKGNRELNEELRERANQLEAMFAVHKLRSQAVQEEATAAGRRLSASLNLDAQTLQEQLKMETEDSEKSAPGIPEFKQARPTSQFIGPEALGKSWKKGADFDMKALLHIAGQGNSKVSDRTGTAIDESNSEDDPRGKFYERYMQKRDAKLREESFTKKAQKDAKLKALHEALERSKAEMAAVRAAKSQDAGYQSRLRAEKLKSISDRLSKKNQQLEEEHSDEEETYDDAQNMQDGIIALDGLNSSLPRDPCKSKKASVSKLTLSTTPRTSCSLPTPSPRSSNALKIPSANNSSVRRRGHENALAQSVPNFSDLKKENTKPLSSRAASTATALDKSGSAPRVQPSPRIAGKEDKARRSQGARKSRTSTGESKDPSPQTSEGAILAPLKASKESSEPSFYTKLSRRNAVVPSEVKPFLRKGNGIGPGAGPGVAKLKASLAAENAKNTEDETEQAFQQEDETAEEDIANEEPPEDLKYNAEQNEENKRTNTAETFENQVDSDYSQNELPVEKDRTAASEKSKAAASHFQEENKQDATNSDFVGAPCPANQLKAPGSLHQGPANVHSNPANSAMDSSGESPASWTSSRMHHSLSQMLEASDVDVSADSPIGSPASSNSHPHSQVEASDSDAAKTRKKWGSAQKPFVCVSHKEAPKGFKRLLKFGRKNRGTEIVNTDWGSAFATSEGDEDTEEDVARKSRTGFASGHPSYGTGLDYGNSLGGGSAECEAFSDQSTMQSLRSSMPAPPTQFKLRDDHLSGGSSVKAPRSFFSLSTFRSKGSESKTR